VFSITRVTARVWRCAWRGDEGQAKNIGVETSAKWWQSGCRTHLPLPLYTRALPHATAYLFIFRGAWILVFARAAAWQRDIIWRHASRPRCAVRHASVAAAAARRQRRVALEQQRRAWRLRGSGALLRWRRSSIKRCQRHQVAQRDAQRGARARWHRAWRLRQRATWRNGCALLCCKISISRRMAAKIK